MLTIREKPAEAPHISEDSAPPPFERTARRQLRPPPGRATLFSAQACTAQLTFTAGSCSPRTRSPPRSRTSSRTACSRLPDAPRAACVCRRPAKRCYFPHWPAGRCKLLGVCGRVPKGACRVPENGHVHISCKTWLRLASSPGNLVVTTKPATIMRRPATTLVILHKSPWSRDRPHLALRLITSTAPNRPNLR